MVKVLIATSHQEAYEELAEMLGREGLQSEQATDLSFFKSCLLPDWPLLVIDLDSFQTDDRLFRAIAKNNPNLSIIAVSENRYHPGLKEALRSHIKACLSKPVDDEEFLFLIKGLSKLTQSNRNRGGKHE